MHGVSPMPTLRGWRASFPAMTSYRNHQATAQQNLGSAFVDLGKLTEAKAAYLQAVSLRNQLMAELPDDRANRERLAQVLSDLEQVLARLPDIRGSGVPFWTCNSRQRNSRRISHLSRHRADLAGYYTVAQLAASEPAASRRSKT